MAKRNPPDLTKKVKDVKGALKVLSVLPYHDINIYVIQVTETIFMYMVPYENQIYLQHFIFEPAKKKQRRCEKCHQLLPPTKKEPYFDEKELSALTAVASAGGQATIEYLLGIKDTKTESEKALADVVIKAGDKAWGDKKEGN